MFRNMSKAKPLPRNKFPNEESRRWVTPPIRVSKNVRVALEREAAEEGLTISAYTRQMIHKGRIAVGKIKKTDVHT